MKIPTSHPVRSAGAAALALLLTAALGPALLAQPGPTPGPAPGAAPRFAPDPFHGGGPGPLRGAPFASPRVVRALELTEQQVDAARSIAEDLRADLAPLFEEGEALHAELRDLLADTEPDPRAVGETVIAIHEHRDRTRAVKEAARAEFEALLTPEQLERWDALQELRGPGRRGMHRHGRRGGRGPGPGA